MFLAIVVITVISMLSPRFRKIQCFLKKPNPLGFWGFIGFWALLGFWICCLNQQLGSLLTLLVDLAHKLSFYLDSPVLLII